MPEENDTNERLKKVEDMLQQLVRVENVEFYEMLKRRLLDDNFTQS